MGWRKEPRDQLPFRSRIAELTKVSGSLRSSRLLPAGGGHGACSGSRVSATVWRENFLAPIPTAVYGGTLLMPAIAYYLLQKAIMRREGPDSVLANALGKDIKGKISPILYLAGIVLAFISPWLSVTIYVLVAIVWLVPDRRIENVFRER
jgi:hypothetical protein